MKSTTTPSLWAEDPGLIVALTRVRVGASPGRGQGLFATKMIPAGSLVFSERASISSPWFEKPGDPVCIELYRDILLQWAALPAKLQNELWALHLPQDSPSSKSHLAAFTKYLPDISPGLACLPGGLTEKIARPVLVSSSNSFCFTTRDMKTHLGLYRLGSRINHSCDSSLFYAISEDGDMFWRAARAIQPGEELTVTYGLHGQTVGPRQQVLRTTFDFTCDCQRCTTDYRKHHLGQTPMLGHLSRCMTALETYMAQIQGFDLLEAWTWLGLLEKRIDGLRAASTDAKALCYPYILTAMALAELGRAVQQTRYMDLAIKFYEKAKRIAETRFRATPDFVKSCDQGILILRCQKMAQAMSGLAT
ncbi:SET domain-containing protein-lysine N-methyltransferase [Microdochium nivale]|nr:SET domain-containing protein-lysine N-methyltransferase [Microdochium nivale]